MTDREVTAAALGLIAGSLVASVIFLAACVLEAREAR